MADKEYKMIIDENNNIHTGTLGATAPSRRPIDWDTRHVNIVITKN